MSEKTINEIKKKVKAKLKLLLGKIIEIDSYKQEIIEAIGEYCDYYFDEYPDIYSYSAISEDSYISYERGIDEIACRGYAIYPELVRVLISAHNNDYILLLEIKEIDIEKYTE
jgi:hypothetical protein